MAAATAGKGAEALILTRYIKPPQPTQNNKERSTIILADRFMNEKGTVCYRFKYPLDDDTQPLMFATAHYAKVVKEGERSLFFDELPVRNKTTKQEKKFIEPKITWRKSIARKKLYKDVHNGVIPLESKEGGNNKMKLGDIYNMHPEYSAYDYKRFSQRVSKIRHQIQEEFGRADEDQEAFDLFVQNNEVSLFSKKGYIQWQGSESQRLLWDDIEAGKLQEFAGNKKDWYQSRPEYYDEFPLKVFRDKIDQETRTAKYFHTLKVKGKMHKSS